MVLRFPCFFNTEKGRLLELLALVWNQTPDSLTGLPYFLCLTLTSGYGESYSYINLFLTRPI